MDQRREVRQISLLDEVFPDTYQRFVELGPGEFQSGRLFQTLDGPSSSRPQMAYIDLSYIAREPAFKLTVQLSMQQGRNHREWYIRNYAYRFLLGENLALSVCKGPPLNDTVVSLGGPNYLIREVEPLVSQDEWGDLRYFLNLVHQYVTSGQCPVIPQEKVPS